jgi:hypothetical protein
MERPRGWDGLIPIGRYWRSALVVFFNYGVDTGTVWKSAPFHEPILWRHVSWSPQSPDREAKEQSRLGWLFYRRVKTDKVFYRPMNRVVHAHIKNLLPETPRPDDPVFLGGGARPNARFQRLCDLAGIKPRTNVGTGAEAAGEQVEVLLRHFPLLEAVPPGVSARTPLDQIADEELIPDDAPGRRHRRAGPGLRPPSAAAMRTAACTRNRPRWGRAGSSCHTAQVRRLRS